jgi:hypothetical protein
MLPCVSVPDLARLDWPAARRAGIFTMSCRKRLCDGGPPAEPRPNWEDRAVGATCAANSVRSGPACRFDRPPGGTVEFLGRDLVCRSRRAGKRVGRAPICVWCRRSPAVTATTEARDVARSEVAARLSKHLHRRPEKKKDVRGEQSACALLTGGAIYGLGSVNVSIPTQRFFKVPVSSWHPADRSQVFDPPAPPMIRRPSCVAIHAVGM